MRSLATRDAGSEISKALPDVIAACKVAGFDLVIVETSGIGQGDAAIVPLVDVSLYVMTPEFGAASQLEKIDMLDFADFVAINKFDRKGAADALRDVRKQYQRNRELFKTPPDEMPVFGTIASRFNDDGVTALYQALAAALAGKGLKLAPGKLPAVADAAVDRPERRSCRRRACAISPRSPRRCAAITGGRRSRAASRASGSSCAAAKRMLARMPPLTAERRSARERRRGMRWRGTRRADRRSRREARRPREEAARHVAEDEGRVRRRRVRREDPRQGTAHRAHHARRSPARAIRKVALPTLRGRRRDPALAAEGERAGQLSVHRRRVRVQARERGPDADVRRRRRSVPHQPPLPSARRRHAGEAAVHRVRLGHAVRQRSGPAPRHLRQGRQLRRVDRHARRHEGAVLGLRPVRRRTTRCR